MQVELLTEETLVLRCHVLELIGSDTLLLGHHLRPQWMEYRGTERLVDADDNVSPHLTGDISRVVVEQTAVNQHLVTDPYRREDGRDGHRSPHGLWQSPAVEHDFGIGDDVRRHTGKRNTQVLGEIERVGIGPYREVGTIQPGSCL